MTKIVTHSITHNEIAEMGRISPKEVDIRLRLNREGFEFEDDGRFSSIMNKEPKPLGVMERWEDFENNAICFRQKIEDKDRKHAQPLAIRES